MPDDNIIKHDLSEIIQDFPGVTIKQTAHHAEACLVCLDNQNHSSGTLIDISGDLNFPIILSWSDAVDEKLVRSWGDLQEATEYGATALAILIVKEYSDYTIIERSAKGPGFDYFLLEEDIYDENELFPQASSRLEVSGILKATKDNEIRARVREKLKQTKKSENTKMSALVIVTEFSRPEIRMVERK